MQVNGNGDISIDIGASNDEAVKSIKDVISSFKQLRSTVSSTNGLKAKLNVDSSDVDKSTKKVNLLKNVFSSFKRIAFYRAIRSAIKVVTDAFQEGVENAYYFSQATGGDLAKSFDSLSTKSLTLKNQLGAAFATLIQTAAPALIQIAEYATRAANAISQFIAALGGKSTYLKAIDYAKEWGDTAKSNTAAAKEWKNQLMGFDEINRLDEPTSGGGASALDYSKMFEETDVQKINFKLIAKSFADKLRTAFDKFSNWSENVNWKEFGSNLWKNANEFVENIDFSSIAYSFFSFLGHAFGAAVAVIGGFFTGVWETVREYFRRKTEEAGMDTWEGFKKGVVDAWNNVVTWVKTNIVDPFINGVKSTLGIHSPSTVMAEIGENVIAGFKNGMSVKWRDVILWFEKKWNNLKSWWKNLELPSFKIKLPHLSWTSQPASGWISNVLSALGLPTSIPKLDVNWYAQGGVFDKASLIGVGEAGKEAVVPLERNTEWIGKIASQLDRQMGGSAHMASDLEDANGIVVEAIFSATADIVKAISKNNGGGQSGGIDIERIARDVTSWQRRAARANG